MKHSFLIPLLLAICVRAEAQLLPLGPERQVNTFAPGSPFPAGIATDALGRIVLTWTSPDPVAGSVPSQDGSSTAILARRFDATGAPLGPEIIVNTTTEGAQSGGSLAMADDGRHVIVWTDRTRRIVFQRFDAEGSPVGGETAVTDGSAISAFGLVTGNREGAFVIHRTEARHVGEDFFTDHTASFYSADGALLATAPLIEGCPSCWPAVGTSLEDGEFLLAWMGYASPAGGERFVRARRFSPTGAVVADVELFPDGNTQPWELQLAATSDGGFLSTWTAYDLAGSGLPEIFARRFGADGSPLAPAFRLRGDAGYSLGQRFASQSQLQELHDGSFVAGWWETDYTLAPNTPIERLRGRWFDAGGNALSGDFDLGGPGAPDEIYLLLASQPGNHLVAAWLSGRLLGPSPDGDGGGIRMQRFSAPVRGAHVCLVTDAHLRCDLDNDGSFDLDRPLTPGLTGTPLFGNLDGDGRPDLCVVSGNRFRCDFAGSGGPLELDLAFGPPGGTGMTPLLADPNGDGRDDLALARGPSFNVDTAHNAGRAEVKILLDVQPGDVALAGDLDGDGDDEPCLARGTHFLCDLTHDGVPDLTIDFGLGVAGGDQPRLADADGNGSDDPCVIRSREVLCDTAHDGSDAELERPIPAGTGSLVLGNPFRN